MSNMLLLLQNQVFLSINEELQKEVYGQFYKTFYPTIYYVTNDHTSIEDIIQEAFIKVIQQMPVIEDQDRAKAWIRTVIKNTTLNYLRKLKKYRDNIDIESVFVNECIELVTNARAVHDAVELQEMIVEIENCLVELKPEYRVLIELRWKRELSYKEIAEELHMKEDKVRYTLNRARDAIKKRVKKRWGEYK